MKCAHCHAAIIDGLRQCYRCGLAAPERPAWVEPEEAPFSVAPAPERSPSRSSSPPPSPPPSPARAPPSVPLALRIAAWLAVGLGALGLVDALLGDDPIVVPYAALHAFAGAMLLRRKRGAWSGVLALGALDLFLALVALAGGALVPGVVVAACAFGMLRALWRPDARAAMRRRAAPRGAARVGADAVVIPPA